MTAFVANTNILDLTGLKSEVEGTYINDATVTVTVKDRAGVNVTGETWPLTMDYIAASDGDYRGILTDDLELTAKSQYYAHITADGGADRIGRWTFPFKPLTRTGTET